MPGVIVRIARKAVFIEGAPAVQLMQHLHQSEFREHYGNIQGTFREHSGNIQGTFREHSVIEGAPAEPRYLSCGTCTYQMMTMMRRR